MIELEISNYTNPYSHLNGNKTQNINSFDLARGMITTGQENWKGVFNLGIFRIGEFICKALAFSKVENGNLVLENKFHNLNQSEKNTISYYFGQGLTKLYAEEFLKVKWLLHVDDYKDIEFHIKGTAVPKITVGNTKKIAERPDLIGLQSLTESHILEAKGYSSGYSSSVMQHAINQVSQIKSCNGIAPKTRTACYYDLSCNPIKGRIIDPENDDNGITINLDYEDAITRYYSFFKENRTEFSNTFYYNGNKYLTTPIGVPNINFGFDERLLDLKSIDILKKEFNFFKNDNSFSQDDLSSGEISLGLDGIILINN